MKPGTRSLTRTTAAWLACLVFAIAYLLSTSIGVSWQTAVIRGAIASCCTWFVGRALLHPLFDSILGAITKAENQEAMDAADAQKEADA